MSRGAACYWMFEIQIWILQFQWRAADAKYKWWDYIFSKAIRASLDFFICQKSNQTVLWNPIRESQFNWRFIRVLKTTFMQLPFQYSQRCVMSLAECVCVLLVCEGAYGWAVYHINQACHWIFGHHSPDHQPLTPTVTICWWLLLFLLTNIVIDHPITLSDTLQSTLTHNDIRNEAAQVYEFEFYF